MGRSHLRRAGALVAAASLLVAACGDDDASTATDDTAIDDTTIDDTTADDAGTDDTVTDTSAERPGTTEGHQHDDGTGGADDEAGSADPTAGADQVIELTVSGGTVDNGGRHEVSVGDTVALVVRSDVADEIHVHGYDLLADVAPGETTTMLIDATIPGVWEIELHDHGTVLLELAVS